MAFRAGAGATVAIIPLLAQATRQRHAFGGGLPNFARRGRFLRGLPPVCPSSGGRDSCRAVAQSKRRPQVALPHGLDSTAPPRAAQPGFVPRRRRAKTQPVKRCLRQAYDILLSLKRVHAVAARCRSLQTATEWLADRSASGSPGPCGPTRSAQYFPHCRSSLGLDFFARALTPSDILIPHG